MVDDKSDKSELDDLITDYHRLHQIIDDLEIETLLSDKYDRSNCIFSLNAGAGGTDAQDWAQILLRMYSRWFDKKGVKKSLI